MNQQRDRVKPICKNRRAFHEYDLSERVEAGLVLRGSEVKSLRAGKVNLNDAYVKFVEGEGWLVGAHISPYTHANRDNHDPLRERKLLMHKAEIRRLAAKVKEKGLTLVPLGLLFRGARVKVELGLGRGRKLHDKRAAIKEREDRREIQRTAAGRE